jgi:hypothetical protein
LIESIRSIVDASAALRRRGSGQIVNFKILRTARALRLLIVLALPAQWDATQSDSPRHPPVISFSQSLAVEGRTLQIDFAEGAFPKRNTRSSFSSISHTRRNWAGSVNMTTD